jgi:hypothetical protein
MPTKKTIKVSTSARAPKFTSFLMAEQKAPKKRVVKESQTYEFSMNGKFYETDLEIIKLLRVLVPAAKRSNDTSAVQCVMELGARTGRIHQIKTWSDPKKTVMMWEGFDDDDDEIVDKRPSVTIPADKLTAVKNMIKSMNAQKQGYAERILDWIKSGAKAGSRPSAISFGLGGFSASSVEDAFKEIGLWPRGVRI